MKPLPPDRPEGLLLIRLFVRIIVIIAAAVGFVFYIVFIVATPFIKSDPHIPAWVGWPLLFCVFCYGYFEIALAIKKPKKHADDEKPPTI